MTNADSGELVEISEWQALFEEVFNQLHEVHFRWRLYVTFFSQPETVQLIRDTAPWTFGALQALLLDAVVLGIDQLLEEDGTKAVCVAAIVRHIPKEDARLARDLKRRLTSLRKTCEAISVNRNRLVAHRDAAAVLLKESVPEPTVGAIRQALTELSSVMGELSKRYHGGVSCSFLPDDEPDTYDADLVVTLLREASDRRKEKT